MKNKVLQVFLIAAGVALLSSCYRTYPHEKKMRMYRDSVDYWSGLAKKQLDTHDSTDPHFIELAARAYNDLDSLKKYGNMAVQEFVNRK